MRFALLAVLALAPLGAAAQTMEPGEWQFTGTMTSPMLPKPQVVTRTECISKADAEDPTRFSGREQAQGCKITPVARSAENYSWTIACPQQGMSGDGKVQFGRGSIESEVRMLLEVQGQKMEMLSRTSGRRLGPCAAK
jgi:hypothetical protein